MSDGYRTAVKEAAPGNVVDEIRTERMRLRSIAEADRAEFARVHRVSEAHFRPWSPGHDGSADDLFDRELRKLASPRRHVRWVGEVAGGRLVGFFNLGEIVRGVFQNAYASWAVSADATGRGYATEGVWALFDLAFSVERGLGLHRVQANVIPENERSVRLAERVGMRREGKAERYLKIAGAWRDHWMYAKTAEEHTPRYLL
jgi:[ribosomal protein S5]-alanine N-acetyltransferase